MDTVRRFLVRFDIAELCGKIGIAFYGIIVAVIMYIVLFRNGLTNVCKVYFGMPNIALLCIMILLVGMLCYLYRRFRSKLISLLDRISGKGIWISVAFLFILQILICWNIYFMTGWDVGGYIIPAAQAVARGEALGGAFPALSQ